MTNSEVSQSRFFSDEPDDEIKALLGNVPMRWGRMSPLCRLLIFEISRKLMQTGKLQQDQRLRDTAQKCGLVGATRRGSLFTDRAFIATMADGPGLASPALFGYTLPNIPLAEAAAAHGIIGPVYAIFDENDPLGHAQGEARLLLDTQDDLHFMIACSFDHYQEKNGQTIFSVTLTVVE